MPERISAKYVLWNRIDGSPVYVGTAKAPSRLKSHLQKDFKREGPLGKLIINPPFYEYVMRQPVGWLGITVELFDTDQEARVAEIAEIARYGIRPEGTLFNRRAGG
ncbi:MAG: hypothetical protein AAFU80_07550 [Pseudomonadota bacterium]